jgi:hypothetical protein
MANSTTSLSDKKMLAHDMFMRTDKTLKEIAQMCAIKYDTLCGWSKIGKWKELKAANSITRSRIINNKLLQIAEMDEVIAKRESKFPSYKEQMVLSMIAKDINMLDKSLSLADYITIIEELLKSLNEVKPELAKEVSPFMLEFAQNKARAATQ